MATFTDSEITDIAEIVGLTTDYLSNHLVYFASLIPDEAKTRALSRVADYQSVEDDVTEVHSNNANYGASISSSQKKAGIRDRICTLLYLTGIAGSSGGGSMSVVLERC